MRTMAALRWIERRERDNGELRALALLADYSSTLHGAGGMAQEVGFLGSGSDKGTILAGLGWNGVSGSHDVGLRPVSGNGGKYWSSRELEGYQGQANGCRRRIAIAGKQAWHGRTRNQQRKSRSIIIVVLHACG